MPATVADRIKGAKVRAAVMAKIGEPCGVGAIAAWKSIAALDVSRKTLSSILYNMQANGLLALSRGAGGRPLYASVDETVAQPAAAPKARRQAKEQPSSPHLLVDIVKSTGRVRLQFAGMSIEIGVVQ